MSEDETKFRLAPMSNLAANERLKNPWASTLTPGDVVCQETWKRGLDGEVGVHPGYSPLSVRLE